jgi:hypothetical protein
MPQLSGETLYTNSDAVDLGNLKKLSMLRAGRGLCDEREAARMKKKGKKRSMQQ